MGSIDTSRYTAAPKLPTVGDMCAAIRAGDTVEAIAERHDATSTSWIRLKIRDAGYDPTTGLPAAVLPPRATTRVTRRSTAWMDDAACLGMDVDEFFPDHDQPTAALEACGRCLVRAECLEYALGMSPRWRSYGVWGGLTPTQRRDLTTPTQEPA